MSSGVLVVDKPSGPTSHDVVARLRRVLACRRVGHAGTLDPLATGVLVVAVGEATKLVPWLTADDKAYETTVCLGVETDTLDAAGVETARERLDAELVHALASLAHGVVPARLEGAAREERHRIEQSPPAFSAIRKDGERAHVLARRGEHVELAPRPVAVRRLLVTGGGLEPFPHVNLAVDVAKGYFVRSLARDFARALGTFGHVTALRRTRSGAFTLADAIIPNGAVDVVRASVLPIEAAARRALPSAVLTDAGVRAAERGQRVTAADLVPSSPGPSAWYDGAGRLVAIGERQDDGAGRVLRGFPRA